MLSDFSRRRISFSQDASSVPPFRSDGEVRHGRALGRPVIGAFRPARELAHALIGRLRHASPCPDNRGHARRRRGGEGTRASDVYKPESIRDSSSKGHCGCLVEILALLAGVSTGLVGVLGYLLVTWPAGDATKPMPVRPWETRLVAATLFAVGGYLTIAFTSMGFAPFFVSGAAGYALFYGSTGRLTI